MATNYFGAAAGIVAQNGFPFKQPNELIHL